MKLKEDCQQLFKAFEFETKYRFNCICVGTVFRQSGLRLVVGGEDGVVRIYDLTSQGHLKEPQVSLETKSGPVQTIAIHDVTKFYHNDLIVGDSCGTLTVFCNQQILCRQNLSQNSLDCLQIQQDAFGNASMVTSDESGQITSTLPSAEQWRINLNNLSVYKEPLRKIQVRCLLAVDLVNQSGQQANYILVSDNMKNLHFLHQGAVVMTIKTPAVVSAMCSGHFIQPDKLDTGPPQEGASSVRDHQQVALGSTSGAIYIMQNFTITEDEFANAKYPVTKLLRYHQSDWEQDYLLCAGHFNSVQVYKDGKKHCQYETPDWVCSMDTADIDGDGQPEVVVGCLNSAILGLKFTDSS